MIFEVPMDHFPVNKRQCERKQSTLRLGTASCPEQKMLCSMRQDLQRQQQGPSVPSTESLTQISSRPLTAGPTRRIVPPMLKRAMTSPSLPVASCLSSSILSRLSPSVSRTPSITNLLNLSSRVLSNASLNHA